MTLRRSLAAVTAVAAVALTASCTHASKKPDADKTPTATPTASGDATPAVNYTAPPPSLPATPVQLSTQPPPWLPPAVVNQGAQSADYVRAAGFLSAPSEMLSVHYHAHLDINVNGKKVVVPPYLGYVANGNQAVGLAPLHTHDSSGVIHIENSVPATFVLGQVMVEWGVRFTPTCLGPFCTGNGKELAVFVNGTRYNGDPTRIVLKAHEEIAIEYGVVGRLPTPPSSYAFPNGY